MATHLAVKSCYSLLSSSLQPDVLVKAAKERGYTSIALTDSDGLYAAKAFEQACRQQGLKPIYGLTIEVCVDQENEPFVVLAKNIKGYQQLILLASQSQPLNFDSFHPLTSECVVLMQTENGLAERDLLSEQYANILSRFRHYSQYFRELYIAISMMGSPLFYEKNMKFFDYGQLNDLPIVALPKVNYLNKDDQELVHVLSAIDKQTTITDFTLIYMPYRDLMDIDTFNRLYPADSVALSDEIARKCTVDLSELEAQFPKYHKLNGVDSARYLRQLCQVGLQKRFKDQPVPVHYQQRLDKELAIIHKAGFDDYFLVVYDFILYAHRQQMIVGPGRGSAAASLAAYCLGITQIDPLEFDLIFERFLNPERQSMPDIDSDFPDDRRDEIIRYLAEVYGEEQVAHIVTFSTLAPRQALRDVAKVYNLNPVATERLLKAFAQSQQRDLTRALQVSRALPILLNEDPKMKQVYEMAIKIEGLPRQKSIHAAGIVLSAQPLTEVVPIVDMGHDLVTVQYSMDYLEAMGLVKMDILGLRNLSIIERIVQQLQLRDPEFNLLEISKQDEATYQLLRAGNTQGIFQLESEGMTQLLKDVAPETFMDISDTIALYRPGPMQFRQTYLENRRHPAQKVTIHPALEEITATTHGILIYQEQIMQVATNLAGFSLAEADTLRKVMSKKDDAQMQNLQSKFINGMVQKGYSQAQAHHIFDIVARFAAYGFNKAHSVAYSLIAYQMAYLKANHPLLFYQSLLSSAIFSEAKLKTYLDEISRQNITVLPPSVNRSSQVFEIEDHGLRMPLNLVKGVGNVKTKAILENREHHGPYIDFIDFISQSVLMKLNSTQIENLIYAGALDEFKLNRMSMVASLKDVMDYADLIKVETQNQVHLDFSLLSPPKLTMVRENKPLLSRKEKEVFGFYLTYHPLKQVRQDLKQAHRLIRQIKSKERTTLLVFLVSYRKIRTKKGEDMAFLTVEDEYDTLNCVLFPRDFRIYEDLLEPYQVVLITGRTQDKGDFIINQIEKVAMS